VIRLIAEREIRARMGSRAFKVGLAVMLLVVLGLVSIFSLVGGHGTQPYDVGTMRGQPTPVLANAQRVERRFDVELHARPYGDERALRAAVADGKVDAGLTAGRLLAGPDAPDTLVALLTAAAQTGPPAIALERVGTPKDDGAGVAFVGTLLLYLALLTYGYVLASGVVEEKSSRVIEILLAAARPLQVLAGKVIGVGLVGLGQMLTVVVVGVAAAKGAGQIDLPHATVGGAALVVVYFVLGYAFYALAFAASASLVSRQEDVQSVTMPITLVLVAGYLLSINVSGDPGSSLATVCAFLPPFAPLIVPAIALQGELSAAALAGSLALMLVGIALMLLLGARIYERAILLTGAPLKLREGLRLVRG
jgi:ABC-2 type transport system permease protein